MKIFNKISKRIEVECDEDEYCPIYLSYLGKYGKDSKEIKFCKNPNVHYCKKYNLIDQTSWHEMTKEEKMKLLEEINLIKYLDENRH